MAPDTTISRRTAMKTLAGAARLERNRLFMAASQSLYAVYVSTQGAAPG